MTSQLVSVLLLVAVIQVCFADFVVLYDDPNYQGASKYQEVAAGDTTCYNLFDFYLRAESIRISAGSCWTLYEDWGCYGNVVQVNADTPNLGDMNNRIRGIRIRQC